jgi:hypothetical protein
MELMALIGGDVDAAERYFARQGWTRHADTVTAAGDRKYRILVKDSNRVFLVRDPKQERTCERIKVTVTDYSSGDSAATVSALKKEGFSTMSDHAFEVSESERQIVYTLVRMPAKGSRLVQEANFVSTYKYGALVRHSSTIATSLME